MGLSLLYQLDEQIWFHSLEDFFIRDEVHSLDTKDYSITAGGEAVEFVFKRFGLMSTLHVTIDRRVALNSLILSSMGVILDGHSLSNFQNVGQARLRRRFKSLSVKVIFDPR